MTNKYRRILAGVAASALALSGCGAVATDTAMTVGDNTVSMDLLDDLSALDEFKNAAAQGPGLVSTADGRAGGASYRSAATFLAQLELLGLLVERFDAEVTDADRGSAEGMEGVSDAFLEPLTDFNARAAALSRVLDSQTPSEQDRRAYYATQRDSFTDLTCIDGVSVPASLREDVRRSLDDGSSYTEIAEENPQEAQLIAPPDEVDCVSDALLGDPTLIADLDAAALGEAIEFEQVDQTGTEFVVFLSVQRRGDLDFDDSFTQARIDSAFLTPDTSFEAWVAVEAYRSGVEVDPRVGTFNPLTIQVDPPPVPGQPAVASAPLG